MLWSKMNISLWNIVEYMYKVEWEPNRYLSFGADAHTDISQ